MSEKNVILGTPNDDNRKGTDKQDVIFGFGGKDTFDGGAGDDVIDGGKGRDILKGNKDNDTLFGDKGHDTLDGGTGNDVIDGGADHDTMDGGAGQDILFGRDGKDVMKGGDDRDIMDGGNDNDTLLGGAGHDLLDGGDGNDTLEGGTGNNTLFGGDGHDYLGAFGQGHDTFDGGAGDDNIFGSFGNDILRGGEGNDRLAGGDGNDTLEGGSEEDVYIYQDLYSWGHDTIKDNGGRLYFNRLNVFDPLFFDKFKISQEGNDLIVNRENKKESSIKITNGVTNIDNFVFYYNLQPFRLIKVEGQYKFESSEYMIDGTKGDDNLKGNIFNNVIFSYEGHDTIYAGAGNDVLSGGIGNDTLNGGKGYDTYVYNEGHWGNDVIKDDDGKLEFLSFNMKKPGPEVRLNAAFTIKKDGKDLVMENKALNSSIRILDYPSDSQKFTFDFGTSDKVKSFNLTEINDQYKFVLVGK